MNQIEKDFIGSIIAYPGKAQYAIEKVKEGDFCDEKAKKVFRYIKKLFVESRPITASNLASESKETIYIAESTQNAFPSLVKEYGKKISERAASERIKNQLSVFFDGTYNIQEQLDGLMSVYQSELSIDKKEGDIKNVFDRFEKIVERNKSRGSVGLFTGLDFLDRNYVQYCSGHIWVLGAFTSVGKTSMMIQKICSLLKKNRKARIAIISTEMTEEQMLARIISNFTGISSYKILIGKYTEDERKYIESFTDFIKSCKVTICDDVYKLPDIEKTLRKEKIRGGVDVAFVDYIQNCQVPEAASSYQEQAILAKSLQALAKEVNCCLVCLSQVSNSVGRGDTGQLEYKGAGELAAVADYGIMLSRAKDVETQLLYQIRKNRHGKLFEQELEYINNFSSIAEG